MTALRYALDHPMTAHSEGLALGENGGGVAVANKVTAAARARQMPRRMYVPKAKPTRGAMAEANETHAKLTIKRREAEAMMDSIERGEWCAGDGQGEWGWALRY